MASKEAIELAKKLVRYCDNFSEQHAIEEMAADLDTALSKARLEGAKAMQEYVAEQEDAIQKELARNKAVPFTQSLRGAMIRSIDPQQVINEGVK
jgi:hypothetical protein